MATYKGIQGQSVQTVASDPSPTASAEGQLWYNSATYAFKIAVSGTGAWASAPAINSARDQAGGAGSATAALIAGGLGPPPAGTISLDVTETYNGTAWTEVGDLASGRHGQAVTGTQTSAITAAASAPDQTISESWDGTSWTANAPINTGRQNLSAAGANNTAAIIFGGNASYKQTELWNGSTWTEVGDLQLGRHAVGGTGSSTAALCVGGNPGSQSVTEEWDGTSWAEVNNLTNGRFRLAAAGITTAALVYGGYTPALGVPGVTGYTESWNGSSWTEVGDMATARDNLAGNPGTAGSSSLALAVGGFTGPAPSFSVLTEEWNGAPVTAKTVTVS